MQVAMISLVLAGGACSDSKPAANTSDTISWQACLVGNSASCVESLGLHAQSADPMKEYKVSCGSSSGLFNVTVADPGDSMLVPRRFPSILTISNINKSTGDCNVKLTEQGTNDSDPIDHTGACNDACMMQILPAEGGWDFEANLTCTGLVPNGNTADPNRYSLYASQDGSKQPVHIQVGNCN